MPDELRSVFIYGRLHGVGRRLVSERLVKNGGKLVRDPRRAATVVPALRSAPDCFNPQGYLALPFAVGEHATLISEGELKRRLGLAPALHHHGGAYRLDDVASLSELPPDTCRALALFDVLVPGEGRFSYGDLATAKQVARLLGQGVSLVSVVRAAVELGTRGLRLCQVRLAEAPWGEIVQQVGERIARLDGQFALVMDEESRSAEADLARALESEEDGDLAEAERLYRRAEQGDKADPVLPFNLGNVLAGQGRRAEAVIAFRRALERDPAFVEAGFNLAGLYEAAGQDDRAVETYRATIGAHPAYGLAIYNYARLLTRLRRFAEALPLWERFVALAPGDPDALHARRAALLCRMESGQGGGSAARDGGNPARQP